MAGSLLCPGVMECDCYRDEILLLGFPGALEGFVAGCKRKAVRNTDMYDALCGLKKRNIFCQPSNSGWNV